MQTLRITKAQARALLLDAFGLTRWQSFSDVSSVIARLEFVQEDSISVCGRMHDLILWPRVAGYAPQKLADALYGPDAHAFEVHFPNLSALPRTDYPYFVPRMHQRRAAPGRWEGLFPEEEPVAEAFLAALDTHGPLSTRSQGSASGHMVSAWGTRSTVVSQVVEKLWLQGVVTIAHRKSFERFFDRTERVAPELARWHEDDAALPEPDERKRYLARKRLSAKVLFRPRRDELTLLGESAFCRVEIEGVTKPWFCLAGTDIPSIPSYSDEVFLLAPLDPLVYDRARTRELFDFDYTWEVYVPATKRRWGYYVLPILQGDRLIGRLDPKLDRPSATLQIRGLQGEPGISLEPAIKKLEDFAAFLGAEKLAILPASG